MSKVQAMREDTGPLSVFWERVVDPDGRGMPEAIAEDIASFTGETIGEVLVKMERGKVSLKELWDQSGIDVSDPESIASFYRDQFVEAYELADWHSGRTNGVPPLNYARAALFARKNGLSRALDFGSGIGTGSLCLAEAGCEVHSADIARELLAFVGHRFARRGMRTSMIDLNDPERPTKNYYDIVTCFDVLEHVPDQLAKLRELQSYVRVGGYLFVNMMVNSFDKDRPMHISSSGNWISLVRRTAMQPCWQACTNDLQVLVRTRTARLRNWVAAWID